MTLAFTEPHPTSSGRPEHQGKVTYGFARGGAGNYRSFDRSNLTDGTTAASHKKPTTTSHPSSQYAFNGIGGAGNMRRRDERATYNFDHELERLAIIHDAQKKSQQTPVFTTGRGGAGNMHRDKSSRQNSGSSIASSSSTGSRSSARRALSNIRGSLSRSVSRD